MNDMGIPSCANHGLEQFIHVHLEFASRRGNLNVVPQRRRVDEVVNNLASLKD
jgi:hypothetical protein